MVCRVSLALGASHAVLGLWVEGQMVGHKGGAANGHDFGEAFFVEVGLVGGGWRQKRIAAREVTKEKPWLKSLALFVSSRQEVEAQVFVQVSPV